MKYRTIVGAVAICLGLTGCPCGPVTTTGTISKKEITLPSGERQEELTIGASASAQCGKSRSSMLMMNAMSALDAADIAVDITTQNTIILDGSGTGTLAVKQGETVLGSTSFGFVVADSMAVAANPAALNAWLANYPSADGFNIELDGVQKSDIAPGTATVTAEAVYGSTVVASGSSSWATSGSGCVGNPGGGGETFPEMPVIDEDPGVGCP
ncbi:hypothetical protein [Lysobacter sp. Root690]|uniref:hypothetical protein n=1 Tax=Lysobacter sp. Root690 TaxID=1736588 RepID=UPI000B1FD671|nr:hypothetical protein [Lysobacter sp. Root690]